MSQLLILARRVAMLASHLGGDHHTAVADAFIIVALPALALALLGLVGRLGPETPLTWKHRAAGAVVLMVGVAFVLGFMG